MLTHSKIPKTIIVCPIYSINNEGMQETIKCETKALKLLDAFLSLKRMVIVTYDEKGTVPLDNGKQNEVISFLKWLL